MSVIPNMQQIRVSTPRIFECRRNGNSIFFSVFQQIRSSWKTRVKFFVPPRCKYLYNDDKRMYSTTLKECNCLMEYLYFRAKAVAAQLEAELIVAFSGCTMSDYRHTFSSCDSYQTFANAWSSN